MKNRFEVVPMIALCAGLFGCPEVPPYPYLGPYGSEAGITAAAQAKSDALEQYVEDWLDGLVPAQIPASLIPEASYNDPNFSNWRLVRPEDITAEEQWVERAAESLPIPPSSAPGGYSDPHVTYGLAPYILLPFGSKVILEGEFPHSRYFSLQISHSFDPKVYTNGAFGAGEVAWVDADIEPLPGHTNPFRPGADRNATARSYRVECTAIIGDPRTLDPQPWERGRYRDYGDNTRDCAGILYRGPWGDPDFFPGDDEANPGDRLGLWQAGNLWMRAYAPDHAYFPWGGSNVYPKITYQLPDGRTFFIAADTSQFALNANRRRPMIPTPPEAPTGFEGPGNGWSKMMGILRSLAAGIGQEVGATKGYLRDLNLGVEGRGETVATVGSLQPHATASVHIDYLLRGMCLPAGRVFTISGRMPTIPSTRNGEATMSTGQARYWSLVGYSRAQEDPDAPDFVAGVANVSIMDDEIVKNASNEYVIAFSRPQDRPVNATAANGVTWVDWGPEGCLAFTMRWMSIHPEWHFAQSPSELNLNWNSDWTSAAYNVNLIGRNNRTGFLKAYQPGIGYRTKAQFEAITGSVTPSKIPLY